MAKEKCHLASVVRALMSKIAFAGFRGRIARCHIEVASRDQREKSGGPCIQGSVDRDCCRLLRCFNNSRRDELDSL